MSRFIATTPDGKRRTVTRAVAEEVPIAIELNGIGYAVMVAPPADLEDFAWGFVQAERLGEIIDVEAHPAANGILLRITLKDADKVADRVRHRVSESSCGLCGIENLEQALRPLPCVTNVCDAAPHAIFRAIRALAANQPLNAATGTAHAAALCGADGAIRLVREDVGRHNAFDKLVGAMAREGLEWDGGFALLSARCSYELVEKAALSNCPMLATISMATALAVSRAAQAGLRLLVLARPDEYLEPKPDQAIE